MTPEHARPAARRGTTLAELIVVLVIGTIVIALCATTLVGQRRAERETSASVAPASGADEALRTLESVLARVAVGDTVWARGDSALEWRATVGVALACAAGADTVVVPDSGLTAWWESLADTGDVAALGAGAGTWERHKIRFVHSRSSGGACGTAQHTLQLREVASTIGQPVVRVVRRTRFMLYKGGEGDWWLGQRTCDDSAPLHCTSAQPVAGPLAAPPAGLRFALDSSGAHLRITISVTAGSVVRTATVSIAP
jgi:Tfp pilus assembly protein PilX